MIERAELPVQRKSTLNCRLAMTLDGRTSARRDRLGDLRRGRTTRLLMHDTRDALPSTVPVIDAFAGRVEGLPRDTGWVVNP